MAAAATDYFTQVGSPGTATTLAAPGHSISGTTFTVVSTSGWPTGTGVIFAVDNYTLQTVNGVPNTAVRTAGTYTEWEGVVASSTSITGAVLRYGTDQNYSAGSLTRVYIPVASSRENRLVTGLLVEHDQDGTHGNITGGTAVFTGNVTAANFVQTGGAAANGWTTGLPAPNTITANGNRSYSMVFSASDQTSVLSAGMRLRSTRTVAAPTQCTSLNGTTQYYSKTSPAGMTFTDDFTVSAWVKLTSYAAGVIASRYNGTSGWQMLVQATGQVQLSGFNAGAANFSYVLSYQSVPLNKWVHLTAQLDMSTFTATTTTSYIMIDGVDVPASVVRGGTNPTALIQAGDLQIGASNSATFFPGKIAQVAIYSAKVTQANIRATISQGLAGTETSLISAYSFNNSINDLNANANNLTANGSAVATNADSPFGGQADGTISSTLDYGIVQKVTYSTDTTVVVQVPEGCTIPTTGGVSAVAYSSQKAPYGMPVETNKWAIYQPYLARMTKTTPVSGTVYNNGEQITLPIGSWNVGYQKPVYIISGTAGTQQIYCDLNTTTATYSASSPFARLVMYVANTAQTETGGTGIAQDRVTVAVATPYYFNVKATFAGTGTSLSSLGDLAYSVLYADNAYL